MGTKGVVGFCLDEKYYVTYNHLDSYAKGLGAEVVNFIKYVRDNNLLDILRERVKPLTFIQDESVRPLAWALRSYSHFADTTVGGSIDNTDINDWYQLMRNLQNGRILWKILNGEVGHIINYFMFLKDSLFCEYGYIINLDDETLDFYRGHSEHTDCTSPFGNTKLPFRNDAPILGQYYPCKLRREFPFDELPLNWLRDVPLMNPEKELEKGISGFTPLSGIEKDLADIRDHLAQAMVISADITKKVKRD